MDNVWSRFQYGRKYKSWRWMNLIPQGTILVATPFIYAMIIPLLVFDLCVELYQRVVFPLLGLPLLSRQEYIRQDRHRLPYLNPFQKAGCLYCGYANGLLQ
ncbi:hypothetical protein ACTRXD_10505 [Nitrospira sp. T9]|uniref:hypothetical protein n=2 Tax=unclassified Nitrospira TaxID=2652172 RepID=UPI003F95C2B9